MSKEPSHNKVTEAQAAAIHSLLVDALEGSLRKQLMSGEYNAALIARALDFLKHNNITVGSASNHRLASLADMMGQLDFDDV